MAATVYKVEIVLADGERKIFRNEQVKDCMEGIKPDDVILYWQHRVDGAVEGGARVERLTDELLMEYYATCDIEEAYKKRDYALERKAVLQEAAAADPVVVPPVRKVPVLTVVK